MTRPFTKMFRPAPTIRHRPLIPTRGGVCRRGPVRNGPTLLLQLLALAVTVAIPANLAGAAQPEERMRPVPDPLPFGMSQGVQYLDLLERYLTLMEKFAHLTEDPGASGSAAVLSAKEILISDGDANKAIDYLTQVLPEVKNEAVQRTIHIELADLYKHSGQKDKALEQLRILMTSAPPESALHREAHTPVSDATAAPGR